MAIRTSHQFIRLLPIPKTFRPLWCSRTQWKKSSVFLPINSHRHATTDTTTTTTTTDLRRTPLYDFHIKHGAKMVPFAGYSMPVQYADLSVGDSHRWTREKASLFDVGHMVQHRLSGPGALGLLLRLTPSSLTTLKPHHSTLSCLLHPGTGGIVDDTIVTRLGPELFYLVTNASNRAKDSAYLTTQLEAYTHARPSTRGHRTTSGSVEWELLDGWGLLALQGPLAGSILAPLITDADFDLQTLYFGQSRLLTLRAPLPGPNTAQTVTALVSRAGYTGEDGFELSVAPAFTEPLASALLGAAGPEKLRLAGLGARDSLRLEAGMCLYGHDLDDGTTPVEAGLGWVVGRDRRTDPNGFLGADVILSQLGDAGQVERKRVGFVLEEERGGAAREGAVVVAVGEEEGGKETIGKITSGSPAPSLDNRNIAMGYVRRAWAKVGTKVGIVVRGKTRRATVVRMPFVTTRYHKAPAAAAAAAGKEETGTTGKGKKMKKKSEKAGVEGGAEGPAGTRAGAGAEVPGVGGASEGQDGESKDVAEHGGDVRGPDSARGDFGEGTGGEGEGADGAGSGGLEHRLPV